MLASELHLGPTQDRNRLLPKIVAAAAIMTILSATVYRLNPQRAPKVSIQKVAIFAPHTQMASPLRRFHVLGSAPESEDDVYVVATLAISNRMRSPVFVDGVSATMTAEDGSTVDATVIAPGDLARLETIFPQTLPMLTPPEAPPLRFEDLIHPGKTRRGTVVLLFPHTSAAAWQAKRSATLRVQLLHETAPILITFR
ncbi:MAG: hypothetical protein ACP5E5_00765 [Acidobacteriaceae bacterium]